ncbi:MAG TPA: alpha-hydroxy acid oxidase [Acidimicrobiales bacterium]|nr:alpha-hydroxy acid oxidase [Acidimicrobiales bacterium]
MTTSRWDHYHQVAQERAAARIATVADARRLAFRRVPRAVFDYIDGGAGAESTMEANRASIEAVQFRPRVGITKGVPAPELTTTVLGHEIAMPILLSPVGFTRMMDPLGDVAGVRAAGKAGTIFSLSSMSGHTMAEVMAAATQPAWFQLYFLGGRQGAEQLVARAQNAGFSGLAVTLDTQIPGNRERDQRHGLSPPLKLDRRTMTKMAPQVAVRPLWLADAARDRFQLTLVNAASLCSDTQPMSTDDALFHWIASPPTWEDFKWLRDQWHGPLLAKGIVTGDDARRAVDSGADAIIVSNHGGRQLDSIPATLPALVEVADAVGTQVDVLVDGGFRRGADVVKAVAIGARAAMIGRPWAYGLAAAGQPGVERVLGIFREDLDRTLRLLGCASVAELDRSHVRMPKDW